VTINHVVAKLYIYVKQEAYGGREMCWGFENNRSVQRLSSQFVHEILFYLRISRPQVG